MDPKEELNDPGNAKKKEETKHPEIIHADRTGTAEIPKTEAEPPRKQGDPPLPQARPTRWGVLTREDIRNLGLIVVPGRHQDDDRCFKHASYDLRLGDEYIKQNARVEQDGIHIYNCSQDGSITIEPFGSAIISTYEQIRLPNNVAGRFDLRIDHALEGLFVQMGTQVEPGYSGQLFALLHNISERPKTLKFRDYETRPFTIEFHYTSLPSDPPPARPKTLREFVPPNLASGGLNRRLFQIEKMQETINELSKEFNLKKMAAFTGFALFIIISTISFVIPFFLSKFTYSKDYFPIVNAQAIADIYWNNRNQQDEVVNKVLDGIKLQIDKSKSVPSPQLDDQEIINLIKSLKKYREIIRLDPRKKDETKAMDVEIEYLLKLLKG